MDRHQFFGEARSLIAEPSDDNFKKLCAMIESWDDPQEQQDVLTPYLIGALQHWPVKHRQPPTHWHHNFLYEDAPSYYDIASYLNVPSGMAGYILNQLPHCTRLQKLDGLSIRNAGLRARDITLILAKAPQLQRLVLEGNHLLDEGVKAILESQHQELKHLDVSSNRLTSKTCEYIATAPATLKLTTLDLCHNNLREDALPWLAEAPCLADIEEIYLRHNPLGTTTLEILSSAQWTKLTHLDINGISLGAEGARAMEQISHWRSLRHLYIEQNQLGDEGCSELAKLTTPLVELNIHNNNIGAAGIAALQATGMLQSVEQLYLGYNHIQDEGISHLAQPDSPLRQLHIDSNQIGNQSLLDIAQDPGLPNLEILVAWGNNMDESALKLLDHVDTSKLKTLNFNRNSIGEQGVQRITKQPNYDHLDELFLYKCDIGDQGCKHLAKATQLCSVKKLQIGSNLISDVGIESLKQAEHFQSIERLELPENTIGNNGARHIAECAHFQNVKFLKVWGCGIEAEGATSIANSPHLENLEHLNFNRNNIGPGGVTAIANSPYLHNLKTLYLYTTQFDEASARDLANSETLRSLEDLELSECGINGEILQQFTSNPRCLENIVRLKIDANWIYDSGVEQLTTSLHWPNLRTLVAWDNGITPIGAQHLAQWHSLRRTTLMNLNRNHLGTNGIINLINSPHLQSLTELFLNNNYIHDEGFFALFYSDYFTQLKGLNLSRNSLTDSAFINMCNDPRAGALHTLWYSENNLSNNALQTLASSDTLIGLHKIELQDNNLDDASADIIAHAPSLMDLRDLDLNNNNITNTGILALTRSPYLKNLETLRLSNNAINDDTAYTLAHAPALATLNELELENHAMTSTGLTTLSNSPYLHKTIRDGFADLLD